MFSFIFAIPQRSNLNWWNEIKEIRKSGNLDLLDYAKSPKLIFAKLKILPRKEKCTLIVTSALLVLCLLFRVKGGATPLIFSYLYVGLLFILDCRGRLNETALSAMMCPTIILALFYCKNIKVVLNQALVRVVSCGILLLMCVYGSVNVYEKRQNYYFSPLKQTYEDERKTEMLAKVLEENPDNIYFAFSQVWRHMAIPVNALCADSFGEFSTFLFLGDWESCLPYYEKRLQQQGISSDLDLCTHNNIRFIVLHQRIMGVDEKNIVSRYVNYYNQRTGANYQLIVEKDYPNLFLVLRVEDKKDSPSF